MDSWIGRKIIPSHSLLKMLTAIHDNMSSVMFFSGNGQTFRAIRDLDFEFTNLIHDMKENGYITMSHQFNKVHLEQSDIFTVLHNTSGNVQNIIDV